MGAKGARGLAAASALCCRLSPRRSGERSRCCDGDPGPITCGRALHPVLFLRLITEKQILIKSESDSANEWLMKAERHLQFGRALAH